MAQPPFQVDVVQIEPGSSGTRTLSRDATDNSMSFLDPNVSAALALTKLVGLRNITGVYIVGQGGDGAPYTAIQDALDDIPDTSSPAIPSLVLVLAGTYSENLSITKDGVYLVGVGYPTITNAAVDATITIESTPTTTPETIVFQNLTIENTEDGEACILIEGAGTYAYGTVLVNTAPLAAGDSITIGGLPLTGVVGTRTSGDDEFSVSGTTVATVAAEIMEALNDPANSFAATITATRSNATVTATANTPGPGGNAITLTVSTTPAGGLTPSGANFAHGSADGSEVASGEILISDCHLIASGNGGFPVYANTVNNVRVQGGAWRGSSTTSFSAVVNCASFRVFGVEWTNDFELAYDTTDARPATLTSLYEMKHCGRIHDVLCGLSGAGGLLITHCPEVGDVTQGGDQSLAIYHSRINDLSLDDTTSTLLVSTTRNSVATAGGTPTLSESALIGTVVFGATATATVTFDVLQPDIAYAVVLDCLTLGSVPQVTAKTTADFTVSFAAPYTGTVYYTVLRQQ